MKKAFITGIAGQDGSYLAEYLLEIGYQVHGIIRRNSVPENQQSRLENVKGNIAVSYGDLLDQSSIEHLLDKFQPDEIYNIAAQSHVRISYDIPQFTAQTNAIGVLNVLEAYRRSCPTAKFYQASSSEMFGSSVDNDGYQRESTPMTPVSPYGCTKVFGYNIVRNYRNAYKLHASNGILFNHESPRRGSNFVTNKVVKSAVEIYLGQRKDLVLGNLDAYRDWGHSKDYVRAMHLILQQPQAGDWVVATGETRSVRDMYPINMEIGKQDGVWNGYNIKTETIVDMKEAGIIDPQKVTKNALLNAASIAGTILLTECVVIDNPEDVL